MKKVLLILSFLIYGFGADAALRTGGTVPRQGRNDTTTATTSASATSTTSARAARSRSAARTPVVASPVQTTSTGTRNITTINSAPSAGRSAVTARSAKQSVISTGTKVAAATQNTVVDDKCWNGFMGCMDSFCMLDNANGGRCICSDKNAEYDSILAEIQSLDEQSYQMATVGVERIEMGDGADAVMKKTQEITKSIEKDSSQSKRKSLDLSAWDINDVDFDSDTEDIFSLSSDGTGITNKTGDALYRAAAKLCNAQIPECKSQSNMMELMYKQRVRSDCTAYENSLRQQRTQSAQKLAAAQSAMREAALEQYRNANKYDLGQCAVQFKQCMQTTGGCGEDFSGCVGLVQEVTTKKDFDFNKIKTKKLKGASSTISIAQSTYDILEGKKELCMTVTQQCVNVRNQVWDTFLRDVAPQVKSAELMAESDMRTSCISNIATCFQKACKDNIDPNDPDGSYDMCLTNPATVEDVCKIQVTPCKNAIPDIMEYVTARLASMRVDACTQEFKACLTSEDRCGSDYTQCVGLDTDTIVEMCPTDKLVACQYSDDRSNSTGGIARNRNTDNVRENLREIATGIFLNIDNNMLSACQKALDTAMIKVCGSTESCDDMIVDNGLGSRSLEYKICNYTTNSEQQSPTIDYNNCRTSIDLITDQELGRNSLNTEGTGYTAGSGESRNLAMVIDGVIYWDSITIGTDGKMISWDEYLQKVGQPITNDQQRRIQGELTSLETSITNAINAIESNKTVQECMFGRTFQGMTGKTGEARFPHLTHQMKSIITAAALAKTRENYYAKYDELNEKMEQDYAKLGERIAVINDKNEKDIIRDIALASCKRLAYTSGFASSPTPPKSVWEAAGLITAGTFLFGVGGAVTAVALLATNELINSARRQEGARGNSDDDDTDYLTESYTNTEFNYREVITTTFDWENLVCHKCIRKAPCAKIGTISGEKYCKEWGEEAEEKCSDTQF